MELIIYNYTTKTKTTTNVRNCIRGKAFKFNSQILKTTKMHPNVHGVNQTTYGEPKPQENGYDHDSNLSILCVFHVLQREVSAKLRMSIRLAY